MSRAVFSSRTKNGDVCVSCHQIAVWADFKFSVSSWTLLRFDGLYRWRGQFPDIYGTSMEYRRKFRENKRSSRVRIRPVNEVSELILITLS